MAGRPQLPILRRTAGFALALGAVGYLTVAGCSSERSIADIEREMRSLDVLYLTAETGRQIKAPASRGVFVDPATGELCFPAYQCDNPGCPGRGGGDEPHLFVHRDVMLTALPGGGISRAEMPAGRDPIEVIRSRGGFLDPVCPACWETRRGRTETDAETRQFLDWARPHTLPESALRRQRLEEEYREKAGDSAARRRSRRPQPGDAP